MVELYFVLGNLFCCCGEIDCVICVYQNLLSCIDLLVNECDYVLYEFGQDFLKVGLFDCVEEVFYKFVDGDYVFGVQWVLLMIYEIEKDWNKLIDIVRCIELMSDKLFGIEIVQFYCEFVQDVLQCKNVVVVVEQLCFVLMVNLQNVWVMVLFGDVVEVVGDYVVVIEYWKCVEVQNLVYLLFVVDKLMKVYVVFGKNVEGVELLMGYVD